MVPREITDEMVWRFRRQITADNSAGLTDAEIHTGLAAVFAYSIWGDNLPTEIDTDGWERQVSAQQALAEAGQRVAAAAEGSPVISDAQWRCSAASIIADQTQLSDSGYLIRHAIPLAEWIKTGEVPA